jgi:hypothetical protein
VTLSKRGQQLLEAARINFELLREHGEKESHGEALFIAEQIAASIRAMWPLAFSPIPTETK